MYFLLTLPLVLFQNGPSQLDEILPSRAESLAIELAADLNESGILGEHGIQAFAFPGAIGDVQGAFHDRLLNHMLRDFGLELIAEREERVQILQNYFRKDGFEQGIYDGGSLKSLGGQFLDNEAILGARIYSVDGADGLEIYAQAELWDARRAVMVWNKTISLLVKEPVSPPVVVEKEESLFVPVLIILAGIIAAIAIFSLMNRREQIAKAQRRGGASIERQSQKKRDRDLRGEAARRAHAGADRLTAAASQVDAAARSIFENSGEDLRSLARNFEKAAAGTFRRPVEERGDSEIAAARALADHDERTLGLVEEMGRTVDTLVAGASSDSAEVVAKLAAKLEDLIQSANHRLGERTDLIRSSS